MKDCNELISIIVPVYNVSPYLSECINSIINQTYSNIEIILVDDGSTDDSGIICDSFADNDSRIVVLHKTNGGLSDARNYGLEYARGEYFCFVDSDDWIDKQMVSHLYELIKSEDADIAACGYVSVFVNTTYENPERNGVYMADEALRLLLENKVLHDHVCTKMFKSQVWKNIRFPIGQVYEDVRTTYKTFLNSKRIVVSPESLYYYRQRGHAISKGAFNVGRLQQLDALMSLRNDSQIKGNNSFVSVLDKRILRTKCYILRDLLLRTSREELDSFEMIGKDLQSSIRKNSISIMIDHNTEKSIRVLAIQSWLDYRLLCWLYESSLIRQYYSNKFQYYD